MDDWEYKESKTSMNAFGLHKSDEKHQTFYLRYGLQVDDGEEP